jgi:Domain of unknown function (DUF5615)
LKISFQADANVDPNIGLGLGRREPKANYRQAAGIIPDGMRDPEVLLLAASDGRVLVTNDLRTMPGHFANFIEVRESPGLLLIPPHTSIREAIEGLLTCWFCWSAEEMRNQIRWLPR